MLNYEHYEGLTVCKLFSESTHILDCATHSKKFNPKSNEYRLLKRNFYQTIEDIKTIEEEIKANQDYLKYYIGHH